MIFFLLAIDLGQRNCFHLRQPLNLYQEVLTMTNILNRWFWPACAPKATGSLWLLTSFGVCTHISCQTTQVGFDCNGGGKANCGAWKVKPHQCCLSSKCQISCQASRVFSLWYSDFSFGEYQSNGAGKPWGNKCRFGKVYSHTLVWSGCGRPFKSIMQILEKRSSNCFTFLMYGTQKLK